MAGADAQPGEAGGVRYTIPEAFEDGGGMIVEVKFYELGPRGGKGAELNISDPEYLQGLIAKLAQKEIN